MTHLQLIRGRETLGMGMADYIWLDKNGSVRFKKKSILTTRDQTGQPAPLADRWTFEDLGETYILVPCFYIPDPTRPPPSYIVLCEVRDTRDICVESNNRAKIRQALKDKGSISNMVYFGFEQDYLHHEANGFDEGGLEARRFEASERHIGTMFDAGLLFHSAQNQPGMATWGFKIGYRGFPNDLDPDPPNALVVADHLILARYLMEKICGSKGIILEWTDLATFISTTGMRGIDVYQPDDTHRLETTLEAASFGNTRRLPHPTRGGCQCVQFTPHHCFNDPYKLVLNVLTAIWPTTHVKLKLE